MSEDELEAMDVESIILTGKVIQRFTHDPRGIRYQILGDTTDNSKGHVVCRFLLSGVLLIITAFLDEK